MLLECSIEVSKDISNTYVKIVNNLSNPWAAIQMDDCKSYDDKCHCTSVTPCFCSTRYYVESEPEHGNAHRKLQTNGQFVVTWDLSLGGQESLLESAFLKAGFEQSVKDYINNDIRCSDNVNVKGAEFFGVKIPDPTTSDRRMKRAVSGNGKCKGDIKKCKVPIKAKKEQINDDDIFDDAFRRRDLTVADASRVVKAFHTDDVFCDIFLSSTIFDTFKERLLTASAFSYDVDVDVINQLQGNLQLKYDVSFEPAQGDGLDQVEEVDGDADEPVPIDTVCTASQCFSQQAVMRQIFDYFSLSWDDNKHECLYQGINCDTNDLVTHIWLGEYTNIFNMKQYVTMKQLLIIGLLFCCLFDLLSSVNHGFSGKTIPELFGSLPSLQGLFLGTLMHEYGFDSKYQYDYMTNILTNVVVYFELNVIHQETINLSEQYPLHLQSSET